jgi:hypothetical protein
MRRTHFIWDVLGLAALCAALSACAQTRAIESTHVPAEAVGNQGSAWELVLGSPEAPLHDDWEFARLDDAMNIRGNAVEDPQPSLDDLRRLYLNSKPDQVLYFRRHRHNW